MAKEKCKPLTVKVDLSKISLDEYFIHHSPIPFRSTYLWHYFRKHYGCGCCCCCADHGHGAATPTSTPAAAALTFSSFTANARSTVIRGGIIGAQATFEWRTSGPASRRVDIQVRSVNPAWPATYPTWTTILSNQNPTDLEIWDPIIATPGEGLHTRGRVYDGSDEEFSNIVTLI